LAEQALRESEENFRLMFDNNPLAMWVYDIETLRFLEVNEAATTRYGYSRDEFLQLKISDIRPSEDVPRLIQDVANTRPDLQLTNQWRHLLKNGQIIDVEISSHTLLFDERPAVLVVAKDITARKRAVEGLRESEARYRNLIETSPDAITFVDLEGTILLCNQQAATMLGYESSAQLVGRSSFDVIAPEDLPVAMQDMQSILQDGTIKNREYTLLSKDGSRFPAEVNGSSVPDAEGRPRGFVSIMRDITERKQAEDALAASEAELRALFAAMTDVVLVFDAQGRYLQIAPTNPDLLYKPAAELLGRTIHEVLPAPEAEEYLNIIGRALEKQEPIHFEYSLPIGDSLTWFDGTVSPMGKDKVFWLARDVTESKRIEEERRAREAAEEANQAKSAFLSRMSHELRTPLNSILGFAQLLKMDELTAEQYDSLNYIIKGGRHLLDLINEVLDIARIEAGRMSISLEPVLLQEVLEECLSLVQQMAADRRLELHTDTLVAAHLHVTADRQRLKQVLLNLLANAIKYNREGGSVSLSCREGLDGWLCIDVTDTGPGIPADKLDRLFSPFERLGAEQGDVEGTGLGLALSKGLVAAMGGSIGVDSTPGNGSTFWIRLPITEGQLQRQERLTTVVPASDRLTTTARTILYIEDNLSNLRLIERILERTPEIRVLSAMQGGLGLDLARQHCPDLILLDLNLPDMTGNEVLRRLREDPSTLDIPVVMVSADATSQQRERLLAAGAQAYLTKPLDVTQLIQILKQMLPERDS
jgi:PAS domain S-box-containing protein